MIPGQWYAVLESTEVPPGKLAGVTRMGEKLVFWRDSQGRVSCLRDFCPHRGVALSAGKVLEDSLECPFHGFRYDLSGACTLIPSNGRQAPRPTQMKAYSFPTYEAHGFIFIWWGGLHQDLPVPDYFDNLEGLAYASAKDPWDAHYSRVIENQLDVAHLPFIHSNSIGRGGQTLVDGPLVEWEGENKFYVYVFNRADDGTLPRKAAELTRPQDPSHFHLEFIFPNLWQNYIDPRVRVVAAFVPVDDSHTLLYLRFYQSFLKIPGLGKLAARLAMPYNVKIAHEDRRVVETQLPKRSELKIGEKLVQADRVIVAYRSRRQELKDRNAVNPRQQEFDGAAPVFVTQD